jgi:hypothetical protein
VNPWIDNLAHPTTRSTNSAWNCFPANLNTAEPEPKLDSKRDHIKRKRGLGFLRTLLTWVALGFKLQANLYHLQNCHLPCRNSEFASFYI